jgi:predicted nucleotidyltransferase
MREALLTSAEVRFIDREQVLEDLRRVAARARALHPEIRRVFLIGSLARGDWTAESDADLVVVVDLRTPDLLERCRYQIHSELIPTDTLVYSQGVYEALVGEPSSALAQDAAFAVEL